LADDRSADVIVVGAGPTGQLLAGDLAAAGTRVTVLEKRSTESNLTRAFAVHARTLEQLDARGLADELVAMGHQLHTMDAFGSVAVSFDILKPATRFPFVLITPQYNVETLLERRARDAGARFVTGTQVTGLTQDADGVDVIARGPGGDEQRWRAGYVVGTDGLRSTVREALGLPFPGRTVLSSMMLADVALTAAPNDVLALRGTKAGLAVIVSYGGGRYRVNAWDRRNQMPENAPLTVDEVASVLRAIYGTDFGVHDARFLSRFHSDERQVPSYRVGRVFLAGDAAHVHSPAGGQGMNTGLQDAANLGWKLAAAVAGRGADGMLDSYHAERWPVGRLAVRSSGALVRATALPAAALRSARNTLARIGGHIPPVMRLVLYTMSGIGIGYGGGGGVGYGRGGRVGRRAPDIPLVQSAGKSRLYEALRDGRFVLVSGDGVPVSDRALEVVRADGDSESLLVRPDGYVAWAGADPRAPELQTALDYWGSA
jgi:2-polyprenyl-6-methoxyphenol hydroxylase-like FAD-dependent oxidoreductase